MRKTWLGVLRSGADVRNVHRQLTCWGMWICIHDVSQCVLWSYSASCTTSRIGMIQPLRNSVELRSLIRTRSHHLTIVHRVGIYSKENIFQAGCVHTNGIGERLLPFRASHSAYVLGSSAKPEVRCPHFRKV